MIKYVDRLKVLSAEHLNCALDDNEPGYIPADLKIGSYRWYLYMYSNMYKIGDDKISHEDKLMFIEVARKFKSEHLISWTRDRLIDLEGGILPEMQRYLLLKMRETESFFELKVILYVLRCFSENFYVVDPFILKILPGLKEFTVDA